MKLSLIRQGWRNLPKRTKTLILVGGGTAVAGLGWILLNRDKKMNISDDVKDKFIKITAEFESAYGGITNPYATMNTDQEFEGAFDKPKKDNEGNKIPVQDRKAWALANGVLFDPLGWSKYGSDPGHVGLSWGIVQFTQDGGNLGEVVSAIKTQYPSIFAAAFGDCGLKMLAVVTSGGSKSKQSDSSSPTGYARRSPRVQPVCGHDLWKSFWTDKFRAAAQYPEVQKIQRVMALKLYFDSMIKKSAIPYNIKSEKGLAIAFDRSVQMGPTGFKNYIAKMWKGKESWTEQQRFEWLAKQSGASHRIGKIAALSSISWDKTFEVS